MSCARDHGSFFLFIFFFLNLITVDLVLQKSLVTTVVTGMIGDQNLKIPG